MLATTAAGTIFGWLGRGLAALLFLFWGAFFLEHLGEWFHGAGGVWPPLRVWIFQGLHLTMLASLAAMTLWEIPGAAATILTTAAFFGSIGMRGFPWIALLNLAPIVCLAVGRLLKRRQPRQA